MQWVQQEGNALGKQRGKPDSAQGEPVKQGLTDWGLAHVETRILAPAFLSDPWMSAPTSKPPYIQREETAHIKVQNWNWDWAGLREGPWYLELCRGKAKGRRGLHWAAPHLFHQCPWSQELWQIAERRTGLGCGWTSSITWQMWGWNPIPGPGKDKQGAGVRSTESQGVSTGVTRENILCSNFTDGRLRPMEGE